MTTVAIISKRAKGQNAITAADVNLNCKFYDWMFPSGRSGWYIRTQRDLIPNCSDILISGNAFYAPAIGGGRDYTTFDDTQSADWASSAAYVHTLSGYSGPVMPLVVDIEVIHTTSNSHRDINTDIRLAGGVAIAADVAVLKHTLDVCRTAYQAANGSKASTGVWLYDLVPSGFNAYNAVLLKNSYPDQYRYWQIANDYNNVTGNLADQVDGFCPSLYTGAYNAQNAWRNWARETVAECRRIRPNMPINPFVSPVYHPSVATYGGTLLPIAQWRDQLLYLRDTLRVDGVVCWVASNTPPTWSQMEAHRTALSMIAGGSTDGINPRITINN